MTTAPNTTASGATELPEFPGHPEPHNMMWNALEIVAIRKYGADMFRAGRLATSAPVAPAPQPAPMPYPTDAQIDAVYEQTMSQPLRSQDAPAVRRFGRAMFLCAWNAAAPKAAPITEAEQAAWHAGLDEGRSQARVPLQQGEYLPLAVASAPDRIWLDLGFDPKETDADFSDLNTPTWSADNASGHGIEYVRADRAARGAAQAAPSPVAEDAEDAAAHMQRLFLGQEQELSP